MEPLGTNPRLTAFDLAAHWLKVSLAVSLVSFGLAEFADGHVLQLGSGTVSLFFFFLVLGTVFVVVALAALATMALAFWSIDRPRR